MQAFAARSCKDVVLVEIGHYQGSCLVDANYKGPTSALTSLRLWFRDGLLQPATVTGNDVPIRALKLCARCLGRATPRLTKLPRLIGS
jgi:hypothetical protein